LTYCEDCRCPDEYCADIVFGEMTKNHSLTKAYAPGSRWKLEKREELTVCFEEAYTEAVFSKLRWNGFKLSAKEEKESWRSISIPRCMKRNSLKEFIKQIKKNNRKEYEIACRRYYGSEQEQIDYAIEHGEFNTSHPIMKKCAKKNSQNITDMFKKKQKQLDKMFNERDLE
jgi:hypothetical protein